MKITERDALYVAGLAHLELQSGETAQLAADLDSILRYVEKLNELDTDAVEPMTQVLYDTAESHAWREDGDCASFAQDDALGNAPERGAGHFKVSRVIER